MLGRSSDLLRWQPLADVRLLTAHARTTADGPNVCGGTEEEMKGRKLPANAVRHENRKSFEDS